MKKRLYFLFIAAMCFHLSACGDQTGGANGSLPAGEISTPGTETVASLEEINTSDASESVSDTGTSAEDISVSDGQQAASEDLPLKDYCKDYFKLGVGINGSTLDNLCTYDEQYMALVEEHFNSVTLSNLMKSCYLLRQQESKNNYENGDGAPVLSYETIDDTLAWCMDHGISMRGHTLVWHAQAPDWFFREGYTDDGAYVDKETMLFRMESYISQVLTHVQTEYPGVIYCWDVVNEAVDPYDGDPDSFFSCRMVQGDKPNQTVNPWYETIGEEYVEYAFAYARKYADPEVKLFYNDFNTYDNRKKTAIYALCESLKEKGLIDGIGMQGYWGIDYPGTSAIVSTIRYFAKLDLEIQITELTISVEEETPEAFEKQAKAYQNIFLQLRSLDTRGGGDANLTSVTFFGLKDHYNPNDRTNARLFDRDYQPKEAFIKVRNILRTVYK